MSLTIIPHWSEVVSRVLLNAAALVRLTRIYVLTMQPEYVLTPHFNLEILFSSSPPQILVLCLMFWFVLLSFLNSSHLLYCCHRVKINCMWSHCHQHSHTGQALESFVVDMIYGAGVSVPDSHYVCAAVIHRLQSQSELRYTPSYVLLPGPVARTGDAHITQLILIASLACRNQAVPWVCVGFLQWYSLGTLPVVPVEITDGHSPECILSRNPLTRPQVTGPSS